MNSMDEKWQRLVKAARQSPDPVPAEAPYGFATRVVANWQAARPVSSIDLWERLSRRMLTISFGVALIVGAVGYALLPTTNTADPVALTQSMMDVTEVLPTP